MKKFEDFEYNLIDSESGEIETVSKDDFIKAGLNKAMKSDAITIDTENRRIIAKFEDFCNRF